MCARNSAARLFGQIETQMAIGARTLLADAREPNAEHRQEDAMKRLALLTIGLVCVVAMSVAVQGTNAVEDPAQALPTIESTAEIGLVFPLGVTVSLLRETPACATEASLFSGTLRYECPFGVPYCWRNQDCAGYCGPGGFEVCEFGCCACAG